MSAQTMKQWEKASTGSGVVYYVNHMDKKNQWEHPNYQVMLEMLDDCNSIKYAAYRTAAKLCVLQRFFSMNLVPVKIISGVFDKHQMRTTENNLELSSSELEDIIYDILFATNTSTSQHSLINVDLSTELILNFLLSVFDCSKRKSVKVVSAKVVLAILCASSMQSKIQYLFEQLADHNQCVSRRKMECFLLCCSSLLHYLAESTAFSPDLIKPTLTSCFQGNNKFVGLTEDSFVRWFLSEPRVILWFPIFYRLKTAENEVHQVTCATCKIQPIRGLRYKCLRCISYDQCQSCFFTRRVSRRHKLRHPMQEYCWQGGSRRSTFEYLKTLIKRICGYESRLQYLPVEPTDLASDRDTDSIAENQVSNQETLTSMKPECELSSIIGLLESENKRLEKEMNHIDSDYLREHKDQIKAQIQRLRKVKTHINLLCSQPPQKTMGRMQSTPMLRYPAAHGPPAFENLLSPIPLSDASTSGVSMSPGGSYSPYSPDVPEASAFSLGATVDSRVTPDDISTWIGKRDLSQLSSGGGFDFSALLCPKQVSASYRIISNDICEDNQCDDDKENRANDCKGRSGKKGKQSYKNKSIDSENFDDGESRAANSSFSLDEVLAQYTLDSRFSSTAKSSNSLVKKTKSLFDISGKKKKRLSETRSALSTLNLEDNSIPCDALKAKAMTGVKDTSRENTSRLSYVSCKSRDSLFSAHTMTSSISSCDNLLAQEKSMNSEDYLDSIRKTCTDMYSLQETSKRSDLSNVIKNVNSSSQSQKPEIRTSSKITACQDRIRRRQTNQSPTSPVDSEENVSSQTLPRMFKSPLQNASADMSKQRYSGSLINQSQPNKSALKHSQHNISRQLTNQRYLSSGDTRKLTSAPGLSRSSDSLLLNPKLSLPKPSLSCKATSYRDVRSEKKKGEWLCDSLNSLLSREGAIESSIVDLRGEVVVQDEQLFLLQDEIDSILLKLRTILGSG